MNTEERSKTEELLNRCLFSAGAAYPFLRVPLEKIRLIPDANIKGIATDGINIYYGEDAAFTEEDAQHLLLHCIFRHMPGAKGAVKSFWDLACDISAEYLKTEMFPSKDGPSLRMEIADALPGNTDPRDALSVYEAVMDMFEDELISIRKLCGRDDHRYWRKPSPALIEEGVRIPVNTESTDDLPAREGRSFFREAPEASEEYEEWLKEEIDLVWPSEDEFPGGSSVTGEYGLSPGCREEKAYLRKKAKYDFTRYLKRFSSVKEEMRLDLSDFDYIPYYYGLKRYGNMPLIEPLEYTESHKVEELVIAIDTSGSCSAELIEHFLSEIENILMEKENFFRRMNIHILQCDARIQSHKVIRSKEEWDRYAREIDIKGRGGTDFTPVFDLVEKLTERGSLKNLKGLLYFTDGNGVYPQKKTPYETAFVFSEKTSLGIKIPEWITPLCLDLGLSGPKEDNMDALSASELIRKYI